MKTMNKVWLQERQASRVLHQAEAVLQGATEICTRRGLPFENLYVFGISACYPCWFYHNHRWSCRDSIWLTRGDSDPLLEKLWSYLDSGYATREIQEYYGSPSPFALLWFDSIDSAQELIGMPLPWITLGYWRRHSYSEEEEGQFYRLWL